MAQKWNLQDIRPTEPRRQRGSQLPTQNLVIDQRTSRTDVRQLEQMPTADLDLADRLTVTDGNKRKKKGVLLISCCAILLILLAGYFTVLVSNTTLTVQPLSSTPTVNAEFVAYPDRRVGELSYEVMTLRELGEKQVTATGEAEVETQATGNIEIIKTTTGTERLIKNTRFRTDDGKVFRIQESVVVPGAVKDASGSLVPGSIQAAVFADEPGEEHNLPKETRLTIPGFAENNLTELFNSMYAIVREPLSGGFSGTRFIIDESELQTAEQALQVDLRNKLLAKLPSEVPADFVVFPGSVTFTYTSLDPVEYGDNLVTIREEAVLQVPLFKRTDFSTYLAEKTIPSYESAPVRITNIDDITFSYTDVNTSNQVLANEPSITFSVLGKPQIVWEFEKERLQSELAGKSFTALAAVLTGHTGVKSAAVTSKPFWKRHFPEQASEIIIVETLDDSLIDSK